MDRDGPGQTELKATVVAVTDKPTADWDAQTVDVPGGHVLQGTAWAGHRRAQGWAPHFVAFGDGRRALLLTHEQRPLPGFVAYAPRGPVRAEDDATAVAARAVALGEWARSRGGAILAVDPELDASGSYEATLSHAGFRETEEIQPSRHRLVLKLPRNGPNAHDELMSRFSKSTRQRIGAAEDAGTEVREDAAGEWLDEFGTLMNATAERKSFSFGAERGFVDWWRAVLGARQARFFVALHDRQLLGALLAYLQGGHYATAFSADRAEMRDRQPGTMHLLRWTVIREALEAGVPEVDLGGVDVPGHRNRPREGDPSWGMYQHKASFGAEWVESAPAHEIILRPWLYRAALAARGARRALRSRTPR